MFFGYWKAKICFSAYYISDEEAKDCYIVIYHHYSKEISLFDTYFLLNKKKEIQFKIAVFEMMEYDHHITDSQQASSDDKEEAA